MSLRVIAGKARGMKLKAVPGDSTRPVMDRVKEALFSIIGSDIHRASFLDLFAGTGSVGIEALSRGADFALFVELNRRACRVIRDNLDHTGLSDSAAVVRRDAFQLLSRPPQRRFDYIYIAPPQYQDIWHKCLRALEQNAAWRHADTRIIVQIDPREFDAALSFAHLELKDQRRYGGTMLLFFRFVTGETGAEENSEAP